MFTLLHPFLWLVKFYLYLKFTIIVQYRKLNIFNILQTRGFSNEVRSYPVSVLWDKKSTFNQNHLFGQPKVLDQADTQYRLQGDLSLFWGFQFNRERTEAWNLRQHLVIAQKWNVFNNIFKNSKSVATTLALYVLRNIVVSVAFYVLEKIELRTGHWAFK